MQRELADKTERIASLLEALRRQQARYELQVRQLVQERREREEQDEGRQQRLMAELRQAAQLLAATDAASLPHDLVHRDELQRRMEEKDRQLAVALHEATTMQLLVHELREQRDSSQQAAQAELAERDANIAQLQAALAQTRQAADLHWAAQQQQHQAAAEVRAEQQQPELPSLAAPQAVQAEDEPRSQQAEELQAAAVELASLRSLLLDSEARAAIAAAEVQKERSLRVEAQRRLSRAAKERKAHSSSSSSSSRDESRTAAQDDASRAAAMQDRVRQLEAALSRLRQERSSSQQRSQHRTQQTQTQQDATSAAEDAERAADARRLQRAEKRPVPAESPPPVTAACVPDLLRCDALQQTVFLLEEELAAARRGLRVSHPAALLQLKEENRCLRRDLLELREGGGGSALSKSLQAAQTARDGAETEALRLRCDKLELLFVCEEARGREERLGRRLQEAERVKGMLAAALEQDREGVEAVVLSREVQHLLAEVGTEQVAAAPRTAELHDALQLVRRAVSVLKAEAEQWRLKAERSGGEQQAEQLQLLLRENRRLSSRLAEVEAERDSEGDDKGRRAAAAAEHQRVLAVNAVLRKETRKEREAAERWRRRAEELQTEREQRQAAARLQQDAAGSDARQQAALLSGMKAQLDGSMAIISRLQGELDAAAAACKAVEAERERLRADNAAFAAELSAFDAAFFDEIEQLKYNYAAAVQQIHSMRAQQHSDPER